MFTGNIFGPIFTPQGVVGEPDKGRHPKKKTAELVKIASFTLPPSPPNERVKNKRMKYWYV